MSVSIVNKHTIRIVADGESKGEVIQELHAVLEVVDRKFYLDEVRKLQEQLNNEMMCADTLSDALKVSVEQVKEKDEELARMANELDRMQDVLNATKTQLAKLRGNNY